MQVQVRMRAKDRQVSEIMPTPANTSVHRYIKDLAHGRIELAALPDGEEDTETAMNMFRMCFGLEHEVATSWMKRVCEAASIGI